jgi:hypothetical protein
MVRFAIKQLEALERVEEFVQQPYSIRFCCCCLNVKTLVTQKISLFRHNGAMEPDQSEVRRRCLREWRLPLQ